MATTTAGALKALIEAIANVGIRANGPITAYDDDPPQGAPEPYVVISGATTLVMDKLEDGGAATGAVQTGTEQVLVDLWQKWKNADNTIAESPTLPVKLIAGIHGARLPAHPSLVYVCLVRGAPRLFERDANLVHHALTVDIKRQF